MRKGQDLDRDCKEVRWDISKELMNKEYKTFQERQQEREVHEGGATQGSGCGPGGREHCAGLV